jgi:hypothetical protein
MREIANVKLVEKVLRQEKKIFGATYLKANGEVTKINGRFGVNKFLKGNGVHNPNVWTVWDNNRKRYTSLVPSRIKSVSIYGQTFELYSDED